MTEVTPIVRMMSAAQKHQIKNNQHRVMWVGSDNSKCHAGSMLHNVMLARLQEVLASFFKLTIEVCESKRTIGMFPIVGDATYERDSINPSIKCASMIDG